MRPKDRANTPLSSPDTWPQSLRSVAALRRLADEREGFAQPFEQAPTFMAVLDALGNKVREMIEGRREAG